MDAAARNFSDSEPILAAGEQSSFAQTHYQESKMNKDQVKGRVAEVKGSVKEIAGKMVGDKHLAQKGKDQHDSGKVQAGYGDLKEDVKKIIKGK